MPNFKVNYEDKLQAVQEYLDGNTTQMAMAKKYNISLASFQKWLADVTEFKYGNEQKRI